MEYPSFRHPVKDRLYPNRRNARFTVTSVTGDRSRMMSERDSLILGSDARIVIGHVSIIRHI
jgi:hypothetical protein